MPDSRVEFSNLIDDVFAAFDRVPLPGAKEQFWGVLQKFNIATLRKAFTMWVSNEERAPTPAAIRRLAFEASRQAKQVDGDENLILIERVYAYCRPQTTHNPKGNPHGITVPESVASRKQGEDAERYEKRIAAEVSFAKYPKMQNRELETTKEKQK